MTVVAHLGIEHPNLVWLLATAFVAFVVGLGVNIYQSNRSTESVGDSIRSDDGL